MYIVNLTKGGGPAVGCNKMVHIASTDWNQLDSVSNSQPDFKTVLLLPLASWKVVILSFWFILIHIVKSKIKVLEI